MVQPHYITRTPSTDAQTAAALCNSTEIEYRPHLTQTWVYSTALLMELSLVCTVWAVLMLALRVQHHI